MILPRVKIQFLNGQLGTVGESADGLLALICGAAAVAGTFVLNTAYTITSMDDLAELEVTATNNAALYKQVSEFMTRQVQAQSWSSTQSIQAPP